MKPLPIITKVEEVSVLGTIISAQQIDCFHFLFVETWKETISLIWTSSVSKAFSTRNVWVSISAVVEYIYVCVCVFVLYIKYNDIYIFHGMSMLTEMRLLQVHLSFHWPWCGCSFHCLLWLHWDVCTKWMLPDLRVLSTNLISFNYTLQYINFF